MIICSVHLALSRRLRARQLDYITEMVGARKHLVVMGDLNGDGSLSIVIANSGQGNRVYNYVKDESNIFNPPADE